MFFKSLSIGAKFVLYAIILIVIGTLAPQEVKDLMPVTWGFFEGITGKDHTGFFFTSLHGSGPCRIINAEAAFLREGSVIDFGVVNTGESGKSYPHLWGVDANKKIIDLSCPEQQKACQSRRAFAVVDPVTLEVLWQDPQNETERRNVSWGIEYLRGLKSAVR